MHQPSQRAASARSLEQRPLLAKPPPAERPPPNQVGRRDRLGGLLHEYHAIAA